MRIFTDLLCHYFRNLVTMLKLLLAAFLLSIVLTLLADYLLASLTEDLPFTRLAHLPRHRLALSGVGKFLGLLGLALLLHYALLDRFSAALFFTGNLGFDMAQLFTNLLYFGAAFFLGNRSWDHFAFLDWLHVAMLALMEILADQLHGVTAFFVLNHLLLFATLAGLHVNAVLIVTLGSLLVVIHVTDLLWLAVTSLHIISLRKDLDIHFLNKITGNVLHCEALLLRDDVDHGSAVGSNNVFAHLDNLVEASLLDVRLTFILVYSLFYLLALGTSMPRRMLTVIGHMVDVYTASLVSNISISFVAFIIIVTFLSRVISMDGIDHVTMGGIMDRIKIVPMVDIMDRINYVSSVNRGSQHHKKEKH